MSQDSLDIEKAAAQAYHAEHSDGAPLSRQMTLSISPEQYEKLFFQPTQAKGDLSKRLGNPTLLGLMGFLIPFQTTMFALLHWRGATANSQAAISGSYYFLGGIAMNIAGIFELILGNTFPGAVFIVYGCHWAQAGYAVDPLHNLVGAYTTDAMTGALTEPYNSGNAFYNITMMLISFVFWIGSVRTNLPLSIALFTLIPLFALIAGAQFYIGYHPTEQGVDYALHILQIAGGFGIVTAIMGWYLAIIQACAATGVPCPLPAFDLSTKVFVKSQAAQDERTNHTSTR